MPGCNVGKPWSKSCRFENGWSFVTMRHYSVRNIVWLTLFQRRLKHHLKIAIAKMKILSTLGNASSVQQMVLETYLESSKTWMNMWKKGLEQAVRE